MSNTNTRKDRDPNGRLIRRYKANGTRLSACWSSSTPGWWVTLFMTRPKRRLEKKLCHRVMAGDDPEGIAWPLGNHKPHEYYW